MITRAVRADLGSGYETYALDKGAFAQDKYTLTDIVSRDKTALLVIRQYNVDSGALLEPDY